MLFTRTINLFRARGIRCFSSSTGDSRNHYPISTVTQKSIDDVLEPPQMPMKIEISNEMQEQAVDLAGVPADFLRSRRVRVYRPAREATQSGWACTKTWKIELDNRERWENPLIGWSSTGDPLSNISMTMDFASKEDAIRYCETNNLNYEVVEPNERIIKPKSYADNFSWNKRTRVTNK
ncbi:NADH-ubiquinone oxidoreductase 18 kDa subunit [Loa loa]|uniref:NADH dehydrogenase [ubiquinone] iron-sulfur protein 4, mitochondrial n=1 Tax=Loa loa TaxID=7209 RepID=A0A1I7VCN1_LOALO|nr:NADH-ubiquinone oxidoreductase 18 kDa subunit [Loa loa]EFO24911.1 NADH-ubiquinone oxidoreductase 18 kDa subunit [Loa loa]